MPRRSERPSSAAIRSRQSYALRKLGCAICQPVVSGKVLALLVNAGKLPDREDFSDAEIAKAVTQFLFELSGERKFERVSKAMRSRW